ncbi:hypothetical protein [Trichocoleus sp. FACHB-6]|nr:hypothetical protein [Trichocoleus sp. FACHB-6]
MFQCVKKIQIYLPTQQPHKAFIYVVVLRISQEAEDWSGASN